MTPFDYSKAGSVAEAIRENGRYIGGGTNLVDLMGYGVEKPTKLVDITHLPLTKVEEHQGGLRIGALVRNSDLAAHKLVLDHYPLLSKALLSGASPQLRNMATTGGNLLQRTRCYYFYDTSLPCNKRDPGSGCGAIGGQNRIHAILGQSDQCIAVHPSDMCVAMAALEAVVVVQGKAGERQIKFADFHRLPGDHPERDTNLEPEDLITAIELPASTSGMKSSYVKVRDRASYAFALVSAGAIVQMQEGNVSSVKIALGGVAHKPWRATEAEATLAGKQASTDNFKVAAEAALAGAKGYEFNSFKIELAKRTIVRALSEATGVMA